MLNYWNFKVYFSSWFYFNTVYILLIYLFFCLPHPPGALKRDSWCHHWTWEQGQEITCLKTSCYQRRIYSYLFKLLLPAFFLYLEPKAFSADTLLVKIAEKKKKSVSNVEFCMTVLGHVKQNLARFVWIKQVPGLFKWEEQWQ